jgi:23S rRNA (cytosine1962-C5)-methyltransferase
MDTLILKKNADLRLRNGHLWIFSNELTEIPDLMPGSVVDILNHYNKSYGKAFFNPHSLVSARLLLSDKESIDTDFFIERINNAFNLRKKFYPDEEIYRLVFGESDLLPGLIIDKYQNNFSIQTLCAGMDIRLSEIIKAILHIFPETKSIIEKNNSNLREHEGLPQKESVLYGETHNEIITKENNVKLSVSLLEGQKTGYYLDQKENRRIIQRISKGLRVMDCFCNQGGFALNAALGGASTVLGIDSSHAVIERAINNARINYFNHVSFIPAEVKEFLSHEIEKGNNYDLIILDPPAFTKSRKTINVAIAGYAKINRLAMKLIPSGGLLASSSCSHHIHEEKFLSIIQTEALKLGRMIRLLYRGGQALDHPVLPSMPETRYLKFFLIQL